MVSIMSIDTVITLANVIIIPSLLKSQILWIKLNKKSTEPAETDIFILLSSEFFPAVLSGHLRIHSYLQLFLLFEKHLLTTAHC